MQPKTRYAQAKAGQKLHIVFAFADDQVARAAICGARPANQWGVTINIPAGTVCEKCQSVLKNMSNQDIKARCVGDLAELLFDHSYIGWLVKDWTKTAVREFETWEELNATRRELRKAQQGK